MLLQLKEKRPDFQVLAGNEKVYGELGDEEFAKIDGLVSGNSNADPDVLLQFTQNPKDPGIAQRRRELEDEILSLSSLSGGTPASGIEKHILGLKLRLKELGILESRQVALYSSTRGSLFQTHPDIALVA
jgi:dihydrodipicolinate synthase/N-acetylneuraminate lyase